MRRSRRDIQLGRFLEVTQQWRSRLDGRVWRVYQIHRADCHVELKVDGDHVCISFEDLRRFYIWHAVQEAA